MASSKLLESVDSISGVVLISYYTKQFLSCIIMDQIFANKDQHFDTSS